MRDLVFDAKRWTAAFALLVGALAVFSFAQEPRKSPTPTLIIPKLNENLPVAAGNNLYCAGYIQNAPVNTSFEIVGADEERDKTIYVQNDYVYINRGASSGVQVGATYSVIRPRGKFSSKFSKKGNLGIYVQEVGMIEVVRVKQDVSIARVKTSCDSFFLGDLLQPVEARVSPISRVRPALDLFGESTGKAMGRIVLARDAREAPSREQIVYIDLGREDSVQVGDYLTIFRPLGKGGIRRDSRQAETLGATVGGFESEAYRGGTFSNQAPRKSGENAGGGIVTTKDAKAGRPKNLRKVVGEMVILNVKERTATALITRTASEIHTGDMVEVQ